MAVFKSKSPKLTMYIPGTGVIRFRDGTYETDDPKEIDALSTHPRVVHEPLIRSKETPRPEPKPAPKPSFLGLRREEPKDDELSSKTRAELNRIAREEGVWDPEDLPNKDSVIDAINRRK